MKRIKKSLKYRRSQSLPTQNDQLKNNEHLSGNLKENIQKVKEELGNSDDIIVQEIRIGKQRKLKAALIYTDGLIDNRSIQNIWKGKKMCLSGFHAGLYFHVHVSLTRKI